MTDADRLGGFLWLVSVHGEDKIVQALAALKLGVATPNQQAIAAAILDLSL